MASSHKKLWNPRKSATLRQRESKSAKRRTENRGEGGRREGGNRTWHPDLLRPRLSLSRRARAPQKWAQNPRQAAATGRYRHAWAPAGTQTRTPCRPGTSAAPCWSGISPPRAARRAPWWKPPWALGTGASLSREPCTRNLQNKAKKGRKQQHKTKMQGQQKRDRNRERERIDSALFGHQPGSCGVPDLQKAPSVSVNDQALRPWTQERQGW